MQLKNEILIVLISKWGCDGSSNQANYKQTFANFSGDDDDSSVFICSFVPIKLYSTNDCSVIWRNNCPSSTRYCGPIMFKFIKETPVTVESCVAEIEDQLKYLHFSKASYNTNIDHKLVFTMVDGKICNT